MKEIQNKSHYLRLKRFLDLGAAVIMLIILSPLFLVLCVSIKIDSKGPIFFKQCRVGIHKSYFSILKFRTMKIDAPHDIPTHLMQNPEEYVTRVGKFLRKTSLDELPQIINIIRGDMSIVGPRPALWNQYDLLRLRDGNGSNDVLPGLTGWAQINGRDNITLEKKAELDGEYVRKMGFFFDLKCIAGTFKVVLHQEGI